MVQPRYAIRRGPGPISNRRILGIGNKTGFDVGKANDNNYKENRRSQSPQQLLHPIVRVRIHTARNLTPGTNRIGCKSTERFESHHLCAQSVHFLRYHVSLFAHFAKNPSFSHQKKRKSVAKRHSTANLIRAASQSRSFSLGGMPLGKSILRPK